MRGTFLILSHVLLLAVLNATARAAESPSEFKAMFDGQSLTGWESPDLTYWSVQDNALTGRITKEHPCTVNQYLVWTGGELADFELKLESRVNGEGAINSGFQFRSRLLPDHDICGYQVDNNLQTPWLVRLYEEFGRHTLAMRGERTIFNTAGARATVRIESPEKPWFRLEDWHEYDLTCIGSNLTLRVDGKLAAEVVDNDPRRQAFQGILGLQLHSGPPSVVQFRNIRLRILKQPVKPETISLNPIQEQRVALLTTAQAWWKLDAGGHGAAVPLRHVPGWEQFELNRRAEGPGARLNTRVVLLDGAYFDAGRVLHGGKQQVTVLLRLKVPNGNWDSALFTKRGGDDTLHFSLFGRQLPPDPATHIDFVIGTEPGTSSASFPVSRIEPNAWHDLVGRYDGTRVALFCDGRLLDSRPAQGNLVHEDELLLIGAENDHGKIVRHFHGELEEAALWSRALSDGEIMTLSLLKH